MTTNPVRATAAAIEPARVEVLSITIIASSGELLRNHATIQLSIGGELKIVQTMDEAAEGPIDAIFKAFQAIEPELRWDDFTVKAARKGSSSVAARTKVMIRVPSGSFDGEGNHSNTLHAIAEAIAEGINKKRWHEYSQSKRRR